MKKLRSLFEENDIEFVNHYDGFLLASGEMPDLYFLRDNVHFNAFGTRKLLYNIDKLHKITKPISYSVQTSSSRGFRQTARGNNTHSKFRGHCHPLNYCHICSRNGHSTQECWFKGRNSGINYQTNLLFRSNQFITGISPDCSGKQHSL